MNGMLDWFAGWPAWSMHHPASFVVYGALLAGFVFVVWLVVRHS